jgi:hypothetical protein
MNSIRFAFRLNSERDQHIIDWLQGYYPGDRSFYIRIALNEFLNNKPQAKTEVEAVPKNEPQNPPALTSVTPISNPHQPSINRKDSVNKLIDKYKC